MSQFYDEMAALVIDLIDQYGMVLSVKRTDPTTAVITDLEFKGLFIDPQQYVIPDAQLNPTDRRIVINSLVEPLESDHITAHGDSYYIFQVKKIRPSDTILGYRCDLRFG